MSPADGSDSTAAGPQRTAFITKLTEVEGGLQAEKVRAWWLSRNPKLEIGME